MGDDLAGLTENDGDRVGKTPACSPQRGELVGAVLFVEEAPDKRRFLAGASFTAAMEAGFRREARGGGEIRVKGGADVKGKGLYRPPSVGKGLGLGVG